MTTPLIFPPSDGFFVIGVDEAGRGCLAGPVTAGAVLLQRPLDGLADSKALSPARRQRLRPYIESQTLWACAHASAEEIDEHNILQATFLAMRRAVDAVIQKLPKGTEGEIWIDGNRLPPWERAGWTLKPIIKGDRTHAPIAAASILAKETRDDWMRNADQLWPAYGFAQHMSYGTAAHLQALRDHGVCPIHRRSFAPVRRILEAQT